MELNNLLEHVEETCGYNFLVVDDKYATGSNMRFRRQGKGKWFTTRSFPVLDGGGVPSSRTAADADPRVRFVRVDLELEDHKEVPTEQDRMEAVEWFRSHNACGAVNTPHGVHGYFVTTQPIQPFQIALVTDKVMAGWSGKLQVDTKASKNVSTLSRWVDKLEFYAPDAQIDVVDLPSDKPVQAKKRRTSSVGHISSCKVDSEAEKHALCSQVQKLRAMGMARSHIIAQTGVSERYMQRLESDPNYDIKSKPLNGDNNECVLPMGPTSRKRLLAQHTYTVFADRFWSYQSMQERGMDKDGITRWAINHEAFSKHRAAIVENYHPADLAAWITKDVAKYWVKFANYKMNTVHQDVLKEVKLSIKILNKPKFQLKEIQGLSCSKSQLNRALKELGYTVTKAGAYSYYSLSTQTVTTEQPAQQPKNNKNNALTEVNIGFTITSDTDHVSTVDRCSVDSPSTCITRRGLLPSAGSFFDTKPSMVLGQFSKLSQRNHEQTNHQLDDIH